MAHRAEEKERRRQERLAQEEAARRAAARKRTLQIGGGAVLGVAVIAVVADRRPRAGAATARASIDGERHRARRPTRRPPGAPSRSSSPRAATHTAVQGHLQDQPADVGQPQPDPGAGRLLYGRATRRPRRTSSTPSSTGASSSSTSRARRPPTWPSCAGWPRSPSTGPPATTSSCSRTTRRCPSSSPPPAGRSRSPAPALTTPSARRHARLPQGVHGQGPRAHPVGTSPQPRSRSASVR